MAAIKLNYVNCAHLGALAAAKEENWEMRLIKWIEVIRAINSHFQGSIDQDHDLRINRQIC